MDSYEISYWVKGQSRELNKTDLQIRRPIPTGGFITYKTANLQTNLEYIVAVYGKNRYLTDPIDRRYYSSEIYYSSESMSHENQQLAYKSIQLKSARKIHSTWFFNNFVNLERTWKNIQNISCKRHRKPLRNR